MKDRLPLEKVIHVNREKTVNNERLACELLVYELGNYMMPQAENKTFMFFLSVTFKMPYKIVQPENEKMALILAKQILHAPK